MIEPHKYINLDVCVLNISACIIKELQRTNLVKYDELLISLVSKLGEETKEIYPYAIDFLFLLNKIKYHNAPVDAFELNEVK
jgi:hypothetical protein